MSEFQRKKATKPYAATPITEGQVRDFLISRDQGVVSAFERYQVIEKVDEYRRNHHAFRHFLNDLIDRGGTPALIQSEFFGRADPSQTETYWHTSRAERILSAIPAFPTIESGSENPFVQPPVTFHEIKQIAQRRPIHELGDGACVTNFRKNPCPHALDAPSSEAGYYWIDAKTDAACETFRQIAANEGLLDLAKLEPDSTPNKALWVAHYTARIEKLKRINEGKENNAP